MSNPYLQRLQLIQQTLLHHNLDGVLIPQNDPHNNEYLADHYQWRAWCCGFTGSAGDLLILQDTIILWTDGRYTLQAKQQLNDLPITVLKHQQPIIKEISQWLINTAKPLNIGVDPEMISINTAEILTEALAINDGQLMATPGLLANLWQEQPELPLMPAFLFNQLPHNQSSKEKINWLQNFLTTNELDYLAINTLDDIAWLLNIRGNDLPYTPVCTSYILASQQQLIWFVDTEKLNPSILDYCQQLSITIKPYQTFAHDLSQIKGTLGLDFAQATWQMLLDANNTIIDQIKNPIVLQKALKAEAELTGMQQAHIYDGLVVCEFLQWLEQHWQTGIDELEAASYLDNLRLKQNQCHSLSFETISGFASNGAIIHYAVDAQSSKPIDDSNFYLVDSGGQYYTGTTDITRVVHLGKPSAQQIADYTHVLKGHIDLARTVFPKGTTGVALDTLARQYLWQQHLNFGHGTGHGVGCFLNVHEPPCGISPRAQTVLQPGMVVSNEPGLYREGEYGIRIENLQAVVPSADNVFGEFYQFDTLTLAPYAQNLIDVNALSSDQLAWLNNYHQRVYDELSPLCTASLRDWLKTATAPMQTTSS